jgi:hypothetical protein
VVGLFWSNARAGIFDDASTFANRRSREYTSRMNP